MTFSKILQNIWKILYLHNKIKILHNYKIKGKGEERNKIFLKMRKEEKDGNKDFANGEGRMVSGNVRDSGRVIPCVSINSLWWMWPLCISTMGQ